MQTRLDAFLTLTYYTVLITAIGFKVISSELVVNKDAKPALLVAAILGAMALSAVVNRRALQEAYQNLPRPGDIRAELLQELQAGLTKIQALPQRSLDAIQQAPQQLRQLCLTSLQKTFPMSTGGMFGAGIFAVIASVSYIENSKPFTISARDFETSPGIFLLNRSLIALMLSAFMRTGHELANIDLRKLLSDFIQVASQFFRDHFPLSKGGLAAVGLLYAAVLSPLPLNTWLTNPQDVADFAGFITLMLTTNFLGLCILSTALRAGHHIQQHGLYNSAVQFGNNVRDLMQRRMTPVAVAPAQ